MDTSELLKKVRKIEIKTKGLSSQIFAGEYHSAFKGRGMAFSEVREYQFGDDVRNIDWNVTARFNHPYVKVFEEERELTVMLLVDVSGSKLFGTRKQLKRDLVAELSAVLAFSAMQNNDKIGIILFSDKVLKFIPPKKGRKHILRIIREMLDLESPTPSTNIAEALRFFTGAIKKRCTAFLISDFIDKGYETAARVASYKHDLIAVKVFDQREAELPPIGLVNMLDAETGRQLWVDTSSRAVREAHRAWFVNHDQQMRSIFSKIGVDLVSIRTDQDYVLPLMNLFKKRMV